MIVKTFSSSLYAFRPSIIHKRCSTTSYPLYLREGRSQNPARCLPAEHLRTDLYIFSGDSLPATDNGAN